MLGSTFALAACGAGGSASFLSPALRRASKEFLLVRNGDVLRLSNAQGEVLRSVASADAPLRVFIRGVDAATTGRKRQSVPDGWKPGDWLTYADGSRAVVRPSGHIAFLDAQGKYTVVQDNRDGTVSVQNKSVSDSNVRLQGRIWTAPRSSDGSASTRKTHFVPKSDCAIDPSECSGDEPIDPGEPFDPSVIFTEYVDPSGNPGWIDDDFFTSWYAYTQACQDAIDGYRIAEAGFIAATAAVVFSVLTGPAALLVYAAWLIANANLGRAKGMVDRACAGQGYNWV
jgi:hypothetical protein